MNDMTSTIKPKLDLDSEFARLVTTNSRMIDSHRIKLQRMESDYQIARVKLVEMYRGKMQELAREADERLRSFDGQFRVAAEQMEHELARLAAMRDAVEAAHE